MQDIMTYDEAHYFNTGSYDATEYKLGGVITQLDENSNPKESTKQYIHQTSETINVTGFSNEFPITMDMVKGDEVFEDMYKIFRDRKTGSDAKREHIIVELWNKTEEANTYKARKILQTVEVTGKTANPGEQATITGSLKGGDFVDGTFNTSTRKFTENV